MDMERIKELLFLAKFDVLTEEEQKAIADFKEMHPGDFEKLALQATEEYNLIALAALEPKQTQTAPMRKTLVESRIIEPTPSALQKQDKVRNLPLYKYRYVAVYLIIFLGAIAAKFFIDASIAKESLTNYQEHLKYYQEVFSEMNPRELTIFDLELPGENHSKMGSFIISNSELRGLIASSSIEKIPDDKDYQLWVVKNETPINVGILNFNAEDSLFLNPVVDIPVAAIEEIEKIMITIEQKGGATAPSGDEVLVGYPQNKDH